MNRVCARCHQVLFSRYPFTWEGRRAAAGEPGGSPITSGEARDFLLGGCARQMSCTTCHDPHGEDRARRSRSAGDAPPATRSAPAATRSTRRRPRWRAHAHHDPAGAGASCIACHMPRKNMGLGYALTRYHRIGSPDDRARVERDRPLECALCHADKTVAALVGHDGALVGRKYDRARARGPLRHARRAAAARRR